MRDTQRNKNQSAYPDSIEIYGGLTKLEDFTKAAMQGLCANPNLKNSVDIPSMALDIAEKTLLLHRNQDEIDYDEGVKSGN